MSLFADSASIEAARRKSARKGIVKGSQMARIFAWMRPNDLVWNYWVNNYLMGNPKATYFTNPGEMGEDAEVWKAGASAGKGSWWEHWAGWIGERSGEKKAAPRKLGNKHYHAKCDAPGTYVFE